MSIRSRTQRDQGFPTPGFPGKDSNVNLGIFLKRYRISWDYLGPPLVSGKLYDCKFQPETSTANFFLRNSV